MKRRPLFWKVYPYYFIIIIAALALTAFYGSREMRALYTHQLTSTLEERARIVARNTELLILSGNESDLENECKEIEELSGTRITIISKDGRVLGDSHRDPANMENHRTRPEIVTALQNDVGVSTRYSGTLQVSMVYVAVPVKDQNGNIVAVVRASVPVSDVEDALSSFYNNIAFGGLVILLLAGIVSVFLFRALTVPLRELRDGVMRFADGDFDAKLRIPSVEEVADLAMSMNTMASQLDSRIRTIAKQKNEREAILSSMSEGVLALDTHEKVVSLNRVAAELLNLEPDQVRGLAIYEIIRIPSLLEFAEKASTSSTMTETEITVSSPDVRCLKVKATMLKDNLGHRVGTVLVFNDITKIKRLEGIRKEFVANVSHELKTPITAITVSVETLLEQDAISSVDSRRFLEMIAKHSERLNDLIEDLLALAKLESESEREEVSVQVTHVLDMINSSVEICHEKSLRRNVKLKVQCQEGLYLSVNRGQIEQAMVNLLDNAIKYCSEGSSVTIKAYAEKDEIVLSVQDTGPGISAEHLPRLFERFYRVDQARSREAGGTGLGLAIVKHIALSHGGRVAVESELGVGSIFSLYLPAS